MKAPGIALRTGTAHRAEEQARTRERRAKAAVCVWRGKARAKPVHNQVVASKVSPSQQERTHGERESEKCGGGGERREEHEDSWVTKACKMVSANVAKRDIHREGGGQSRWG